MIAKACDKTPPPVAQPTTGVVSSYEPPVRAEPYGTVLFGGQANSRTFIVLNNDMQDAAYIKVIRDGAVHALVYLRPKESHRLSVAPGHFSLRYVAGPSNQWRGQDYHFGSSSSYFQGGGDRLDDGDEWTVRLYSRYVRRGVGGGGVPKIGQEEF
jgi:hypothetical protein